MARILVRSPSGKVRLWCDTTSQWVSKLLTKDKMVLHLIETGENTASVAVDRVHRLGYDKDHLAWLDEFFDSQYKALSRLSRRVGKEWERAKAKAIKDGYTA